MFRYGKDSGRIVIFISRRSRIVIIIAYIRGSSQRQKHWTYKGRRQLHLRLPMLIYHHILIKILGPLWFGFGPVRVCVYCNQKKLYQLELEECKRRHPKLGDRDAAKEKVIIWVGSTLVRCPLLSTKPNIPLLVIPVVHLVVGEGGEEHLPVRDDHLLALKSCRNFVGSFLGIFWVARLP